MLIRKHWLFAIVLLINCSAVAQEERSLARKGNQAYKDEAYSEAEVKFRKSLKKGSDFNKARYNLANTLVKQERYKQAAEKFNQVVQNADNEDVKAKAYHNMGNAFLKAKKLDKSIKAYKNALRLNPQNEDARYNLSYALKKRKKQQKQQKQQKQKQQKQQKKSGQKQNKGKKQKGKQNQKQQANKNQQQKKNKKQQKQNNQQRKQKQQTQKQQKAQKTGAKKGKQEQMSKRQMQQILRAIQANEKDLQRKILKKKREGSPQDDNQKEW